MEYLRIEEVIDFHDLLIDKYGGLSGIRDLGLLTSAMAMPMQTFENEELHQTVYEKAAAYLYHIVKNHPFFDGNKRTGVFVCLVFLQRNRVHPNYDAKFLEELTVAVAAGRANKTEVAILLQAQNQ